MLFTIKKLMTTFTSGFWDTKSKQRSYNWTNTSRICSRILVNNLDHSNEFKESNGWLDKFPTRYNISLRVISSDSRTVNEDTIIDCKSRLLNIMDPEIIFNCDETGLLLQVNA